MSGPHSYRATELQDIPNYEDAHLKKSETGLIGQMSSSMYVEHRFGSMYSAPNTLDLPRLLNYTKVAISFQIPNGTTYDIY